MKNVKGTTDFYPEEEIIKNTVFNSFNSTAKSFGFNYITTPIIENFELLSKKQGEEIRTQIFSIEKKGNEDLAMRAEFTPSFARLFIQKQKQLSKPVKWFCIDRVWRYEKPQAGRDREFYQYNVELYGTSEAIADAEIISLAIESLKNLGVNEKDFVVNINNRKLLQGLIEQFTDNVNETIGIIDKRKKINEKDFIKMLKDAGVKKPDELIKILDIKDVNDLKPTNKLAKEGLDKIKQVLSLLDYNCVNFSIETARGLSYYTGTVFEIYDKQEKFRALCGGGRYDKMIETFGGDATPAIGFGMGWSTVFLFLKELNLLPESDLGPDYFIAVIDEEKEALKIAQKLRKKYSVVVNLVKRNLGNQIKFANNINAKNVIVVGSQEIKTGEFKVKELKTGKEKIITLPCINSGKL